ncbi:MULTISPECIES: spore coat protein CotJB [Sellimonas]|uniref:Spore coat protein CotJB n=1 Tax=Sellimonas caecigallum TaxID=2592333 RepID=A0ABS7L461_9FIRM|nr:MULTISPECIES: spore coat protein CotJB [Sellimonas]MBY0757823.1 spore coat protein CotJB [Sellimonas caecigallum]OUP02350.1 spore coat protein CotJB [Drancourtella sp. An210]OUP64048.1 spore coat protein CotJB [Drancourtella sp. An177]
MKEFSSRKDLLNHINTVSFAVNDIQLYLNTHPEDTEALAYFHEYKEKRVKALKEYATCYGPLTIDTVDASACDRWNWVNEPWPWQEGGC